VFFEELNRPKLGEVKIIIHGLKKILNCETCSRLHDLPSTIFPNPHNFHGDGFRFVPHPNFCRVSSHGVQVLSPSSVEVNMCNLNRREYESWDLPLHMGPKSLVLSMTINTYITTLFVGLKLGPKSWTQLATQVPRFLKKIIKISQDLI